MINQIYDTICLTNDKLIESGEDIVAVCFFIKGEDSKVMPIDMKKRTLMQHAIKGAAVKTGVDGYILILSTETQKIDKNTGVTKTGRCILRILYTPKEKITELAWYENGKIIEKERHNGRAMLRDLWDVWNDTDTEIVRKGRIQK